MNGKKGKVMKITMDTLKYLEIGKRYWVQLSNLEDSRIEYDDKGAFVIVSDNIIASMELTSIVLFNNEIHLKFKNYPNIISEENIFLKLAEAEAYIKGIRKDLEQHAEQHEMVCIEAIDINKEIDAVKPWYKRIF